MKNGTWLVKEDGTRVPAVRNDDGSVVPLGGEKKPKPAKE